LRFFGNNWRVERAGEEGVQLGRGRTRGPAIPRRAILRERGQQGRAGCW
jgi:hypothetical protein